MTFHRRPAVLAALLAGWAHPAACAPAGQQEVRFVSCPVYRDTNDGAKSGCWLATDPATGVQYDISLGNIKPDWNRPVLVEGRPSGKPAAACGAPVLEPAVASVLEGRCTRHVLPAEGHRGHRFVLPARHISPLDHPGPVPGGPYGRRVFTALFGYGRSFLDYQFDDWLVEQAVAYISAARSSRVVVTGYADTRVLQVSGNRLAERPELGRERAERVAEALRRLGVAPSVLELRWRTDPLEVDAELADGLRAPTRRRVDIDVFPGLP